MGTRLKHLAEAVPTNALNLCFEQKYENCQNFSSESFHFFGGKILSIYLNRRVFVMYSFVKCGYSIYVFLDSANLMSRYGYLELLHRDPWTSRQRESIVDVNEILSQKVV